MAKTKPTSDSEIGVAAPPVEELRDDTPCPKCGALYADPDAAAVCGCDRRFVVIRFHEDTAAFATGMTHGVVDEENGRCYEYPSEQAARDALPSFDVDPDANDPWKPHYSSEYDQLLA